MKNIVQMLLYIIEYTNEFVSMFLLCYEQHVHFLYIGYWKVTDLKSDIELEMFWCVFNDVEIKSFWSEW